MQHLIPKVYFFFIPKFCEKLIVIWNRSLWSRFSVIRNFGYLKQILIPLGGSNNWESIVYFKQRNSCEDKKSRNLGNKLSQIFLFFFFLSGFSFTDTNDSQDSREREVTIFYSTLLLPPVYEYWDIYLQFCMWHDYHIFLIKPLVFTNLLLDKIYHLIELPFDWLMMWC